MPDNEAWIVREGQDVLGNDGKKIGDVTGSAGNALIVKRGRLFSSREFSIPASAIASIDRSAIHLNVSAATATSDAWRRTSVEVASSPAMREHAASATASGAAADSWTISEGMNVIGADGERIGEVADGNAEALSVRIGRLFSHVVPIAADEITDVRDQVVHVRTTRAALEQRESSTAMPPPATTVSAATATAAASNPPSVTPLGDLQGRITNAWRNVTGPSESQESTSASAPASATAMSGQTETASPEVADSSIATSTTHDTRFSDLHADPIVHQDAIVEAASVDTIELGSTADFLPDASELADIPGDTVGAAADASTLGIGEHATSDAVEPDTTPEAGLLDTLRNRIGGILDRPAQSTTLEGDLGTDVAPAATDGEAASQTPDEPSPAGGIFDSVRTKVASFMDSTPAPSDAASTTDDTAADTDTQEADADATTDLRSGLSDVKGRVTSFLDRPSPVAATDESGIVDGAETQDGTAEFAVTSDETAAAFDEYAVASDDLAVASDETAAASDELAGASGEYAVASDELAAAAENTPLNQTSSRFSVVAGHGDDDNLFAGLADAEEGAENNSTSPETTVQPDASAQATEAISSDPQAGAGENAKEGYEDDILAAMDADPVATADYASSRPDGADAAIDLDTLAADSAMEGVDARHVEDEAIVAESSRFDGTDAGTDAPFSEGTNAGAESPLSDFTRAGTDAPFSEGTNAGDDAPWALSDATVDTTSEPVNEGTDEDTTQGPGPDSSWQSTLTSARDDSATAWSSTSTSARDEATIVSAQSGDSVIADNATSGTLANASDAVAAATRQDSTIANNALHGTLSDGDSLARSWTAGAAASTHTGADATASGTDAAIEGATPLSAETAATESDAPERVATETAADAGADTDASQARNASPGPVATEGIDWVAAVEGVDEPHGWTVKGNASSGLYHTTESRFYERTIPEIWFPDGAAAERSGYQLPKSMRHAGSETASSTEHAAQAALTNATGKEPDAERDGSPMVEPAAGDVAASSHATDAPAEPGASDAPNEPDTLAAGDAETKLGPAETEGIDWVTAIEGVDEPHGWTVKGNASSGLYHTTESRFYERTMPEIWFPDGAAAERSGYQLPKSMRHAGSETASSTEHAAQAALANATDTGFQTGGDDSHAVAPSVDDHAASSYGADASDRSDESDSLADQDIDPSMRLGPSDTEGIDWIVAVEGEDEPNGWTVKGNANSGIYHTTESPAYHRVEAEVWFPDGAAAERAGFRAPKSMHHAGAGSAAATDHAAQAALANATDTGFQAGGDDSHAVTPAVDDHVASSRATDAPAEPDASDAPNEPDTQDDGDAETKLGPAETEGIDWVAAVEGVDEPHGWTVKGNANSGLYHTTESRFYERTIPEIWFPSAAAAERVGYQLPKSMRHAGSETASSAEHAAERARDATEDAS